MLKVNLDTDISNLIYIDYMQRKQEEFNAELNDHLENERAWKSREFNNYYRKSQK